MKRILVFGATGAVGRRVVAEARSRGHDVTAAIRHPDRAEALPAGIRTVVAEICEPAAVRRALRGQDIAVSALRPPEGREPELVAYTRTLLQAGRETGVPLVIVGGAASLRLPDDPAWTVLTRPGFLPDAVRPIAEACHAQRQLVLSRTDVLWSHLCPPASLQPGRRHGRYRTGSDMLVTGEDGRSEISMEDFAVAILDEAESRAHAGRSFTVGW
jgi:putative NADH-flavin reductase